MNRTSISRKAFTLIELLVVVLILGILVAVALPSYLSSVSTAKVNTTNANAKTLATAIQAQGVSTGAYDTAPLTDTTVLKNLGGNLPANPCNNDNNATGVAGDWTISAATATSMTITPANAAGCSPAPQAYTINL